jgi:hypothetical protein
MHRAGGEKRRPRKRYREDVQGGVGQGRDRIQHSEQDVQVQEGGAAMEAKMSFSNGENHG